ncbi:hypothetical protein LQ252_08300 [Klebsiella variicola]|uniref:hypothetical protein n=1 Tax=Klebsiella variicola TaxID=244366 RepID=UPI00311D6570
MKKIIIFFVSLVYSCFLYAHDSEKYIGVCFHPEKAGLTNNQLFEVMGNYKFSSYRTDYRWSNTEKAKGVFNIPSKQLDDLINTSRQNNIKPLIILGYTNSLYGNGKPVTKEYQLAFARYVTWVANRYKGKGIIYEIYNEWWHGDLKGFSHAQDAESAKQYFELIKLTSNIIRKVDSSATIIAGSMNPLDSRHINWLLTMMDLGLSSYIDGVSIHPYSTNNPLKDFSKIDEFEVELRNKNQNHQPIDIYITEMGYSNSSKGKLSISEQNNYAKAYMQLVKSKEYIKGIWWYELVNEENHDDYESNFGLLNSDLSEKSIMKGFMSAH